MKKLSLKASSFQKGDVLTRMQLRKVLGGNGSYDACKDECDPTLGTGCDKWGDATCKETGIFPDGICGLKSRIYLCFPN